MCPLLSGTSFAVVCIQKRGETMKVAVTVWENRISPVFDASRHLLIAEIAGDRILSRSTVMFDPGIPSNLSKLLSDLGVAVLICGAVSQFPATILAADGITLIPFITGDVERVLETYAKGRSLAPTFIMPGCGGDYPRIGKPAR